jgi:predicted cupin superfamily sugar epimerase
MTDTTLRGRARELVQSLGLTAHPEGGFYREVFRSPRRVRGDGGERRALTVIHFLLPAGTQSAMHRVRGADEAWHFVEGDPLELLWLTEAGETRVRLGALADGGVPVAVVPAGAWQAARPLGAYALVSCDVAPGFEFADFTLLRDVPDEARALRARHVHVSDWLQIGPNLLQCGSDIHTFEGARPRRAFRPPHKEHQMAVSRRTKRAVKKAAVKKAARKRAVKKAVKKSVRRRAVKKAVVKKAVRRRVAKKAVKRAAVKKAVKRRAVKKAVKRRAVKRAVKRAIVRRKIMAALSDQPMA